MFKILILEYKTVGINYIVYTIIAAQRIILAC